MNDNNTIAVDLTDHELVLILKGLLELGDYRAAGYTPEQVSELEDRHHSECMQIAHYDDELNENRGWIPCKDRYPDEDVVVLAYTVNIDSQKIEIVVAHWDNEEGWCLNFSDENLSDYYLDVTHWMPLPAPPAERKEGEENE